LSEVTASDKKIGDKKITVRPFKILSHVGDHMPDCCFLVHNLFVHFSAMLGVSGRACVIAHCVARIKAPWATAGINDFEIPGGLEQNYVFMPKVPGSIALLGALLGVDVQ
jgi:hypothetical protein